MNILDRIIRHKYMYIALLLTGNILFAQGTDADIANDQATDTGIDAGFEDTDVINTPPEVEGSPATPLDMYEGILLGIAILLIVGYFLYNKYRRYSRLLK